MNQKIRFPVVVTFFICASPLLCIYKSFIPGTMLGEMVLIMLYGWHLLFYRGKPTRTMISTIILIVYLFSTYFMRQLFIPDNNSFTSVIVRIIRYSTYLLVIGGLAKSHFDGKTAIKVIEVLLLICGMYCILQFTVYQLTGILLPGYIDELIYETSYTTQVVFTEGSRYNSLFYEPSHFAMFMLIALTYYFFANRGNNKQNLKIMITAVISFVSLLISTSGVGYGGICLIFVLFVFSRSKGIKLGHKIIIVTLLSGIVLYMLNNSKSILFTINRLMNSEAIMYRTQAYTVVLKSMQRSIYNALFGYGYGNTATADLLFQKFKWFSSFPYIAYCTGVLGCVVTVIILYRYYKLAKKSGCVQVFIMMIYLGALTEILYNYYVIVGISLSVYACQEGIARTKSAETAINQPLYRGTQRYTSNHFNYDSSVHKREHNGSQSSFNRHEQQT